MFRSYSSRACASQPAARAIAKMASPAPWIIPAARLREDRLGHRETRRPGRARPDQVEQQNGTRIARLIHEVAESGQPFPPPEQVAHHPRRLVRVAGGAEHDLGGQGRAAVQGAAERAQPGGDHGVRIGPHRGGHPGSQGGRGELVIGEQHERRAHGVSQAVVQGSRAQAGHEPAGDGGLSVIGRPAGGGRRPARQRQAAHHAGDERPAGRDHGRVIQLQPELVGGGQRRHDDLQPLQRQRPGRQRGLSGGAGRQGLGGGLPSRAAGVQ